MANCPKCGYKLRMIDIKAECPKCGVNLIYFNQDERLAEDADRAEAEHIKMQPKIDRVKFALKGTKLSIVRLIMLLLPIGSLFLPLVNVSLNLPYRDDLNNVNISILNVVMDILLEGRSEVLELFPKSAVICFFIAMASVLIAAVFGIANLICVAMSCSPRGFKRNIILSSCGAGFSIISIVSFLVFNSAVEDKIGMIYDGKLGIGAILVVVMFIAIIAINIIIKKQNVPVKYTDVSEYVERLKKREIEKAEVEARNEAIRKAYREKQAVAK
jgi:hypothetical protein